MNRVWWLVTALMLSIGVNVGILVARLTPGSPPGNPEDRPPIEQGLEKPGPEMPVPDNPDEIERRLPRIFQRIADEMGLEGEKRQEFLEIQRTFFLQGIAQRRRMMKAQDEIRRELWKDKVDQEKVRQMVRRTAQTQVAMEVAFVDQVLRTREILDEEQAEIYRRFLRHARQRMGAQPGPGGRQQRPGPRERFGRPRGPGPPDQQP